MKYEVGDRVKIKSLDWYNEHKDEYGYIYCGSRAFFTKMSDWCGKIATIKEICKTNCYRLEEYDFEWTDEMIEGLVEEETKPEPKFKVGDSVEVLKSGNVYTISQMKFNGKEFVYTLSNNGSTVSCFSEEEIEFTEEDKYWCDIMSESDPTTYVLPQGYQFVDENGNVINAQKIVLERKKKQYPKTYEECCKVLDFCGDYFLTTYDADCTVKKEVYGILQQVNSLTRLLICKSVYWRIVGEEMGLGKPWKPDWKNDEQFKYVIICRRNCVIKDTFTAKDVILAFPTPEMRDAFYANFKEDIEKCKELL